MLVMGNTRLLTTMCKSCLSSYCSTVELDAVVVIVVVYLTFDFSFSLLHIIHSLFLSHIIHSFIYRQLVTVVRVISDE